jgi:hypothetical protein
MWVMRTLTRSLSFVPSKPGDGAPGTVFQQPATPDWIEVGAGRLNVQAMVASQRC